MSLQAFIVIIHDPPRLHFEAVKLLNFDFNEDSDPSPCVISLRLGPKRIFWIRSYRYCFFFFEFVLKNNCLYRYGPCESYKIEMQLISSPFLYVICIERYLSSRCYTIVSLKFVTIVTL